MTKIDNHSLENLVAAQQNTVVLPYASRAVCIHTTTPV